MKRSKLFVFGAICVVIGTIIIWPAQAHRISSRDAHTFMGYHLRSFAFVSWVKNKVFNKSQSDNRYINRSGSDTQWGRLNVNDIRYFNGIYSGITIAAATFRPATSGQTYSGSSNGGSVYSDGKMIAGINLPQGAYLTSMTYYYYDTNSSVNSTVTLRKMAFSSNGNDVAVQSASSSGSSGYGSKAADISIGTRADTSTTEYFLLLENSSANNQLVAVKIRYYITKPY